MDRSLDDIVSERQQRPPRGPRGGRYNNDRPREPREPREPIRKPRDAPRDLDRDWVHDRYEDNQNSRPTRDIHQGRNDTRIDRYEPDSNRSNEAASKIRVENLHYDLSETDLRELFERIGPTTTCQILYDRSDRSKGIAFVTYATSRDAQRAVREYNGANAYGQPIQLTLVPSGPSNTRAGRSLDERISAPERSLFDRIDDGGRRSGGRPSRRSESPKRTRRSDVTRPAPEYIDRYIPGGGRDDSRRRDRSRSPLRRGGRGGGRGGRRDERRGGRGRDGEGRPAGGARPRKTADELDAEMEDYWGGAGGDGDNVQKNEVVGGADAGAGGVATDSTAADITGSAIAQQGDMDDVDMIE